MRPARGLRPWRLAGIALIYAAAFAGQTWVTREYFTRRVPGGNDFYPRWEGGCGLLRAGRDPYSDEATRAIQRGMYGRPAQADEDQAAFAYPVYTLVLTWPTCLSADFATVQAAWMTALIHLTILGAAIARAVAKWRPRPTLWIVTAVWCVVVYPVARAILLGQLSLVVFVLLMLSLWGIVRQKDYLAGALLALATIKPQMILLVVPWLLWWSVWSQRRRILLGFLLSLALLTGVPLLVLPTWPAEFVHQLSTYTEYTEFGSALWIMTTYYLGTPPALELFLTGLVGAALAYAAWHWRRAEPAKMLWVSSLMLLGTHFVAPRTATTHFAPYLLPLFLIFEQWRSRRGHGGDLLVGLVEGLVFLGSWALFLFTVDGIQESAINYIPLPMLLLVALLLTRKRLVQTWNLG